MKSRKREDRETDCTLHHIRLILMYRATSGAVTTAMYNAKTPSAIIATCLISPPCHAKQKIVIELDVSLSKGQSPVCCRNRCTIILSSLTLADTVHTKN